MDRIDRKLKSTKDDETHVKTVAYKRREWLSALLETGNEKVVVADQKYKQINPKPIEHPGLLRRTESWWGETSSMTIEKLSGMSNAQIVEYLANFKEPEIVIRQSDPTQRGLAQTLEKCVAANPRKFADNLHPFQSVGDLYQYSLLQGFLTAWRDKEDFDWTNLFGFIRQIFSSEYFWVEQYEVGFNYRSWVLSTTADLIAEGTKDDTHAFDKKLLPLAEEILLILVEKAEPSILTPTDSSLDALSSDRGKIFSAVVDYALRFARVNESEYTDCLWPYAIKADFTKRLDRNVETSLEFSYILGLYLPELLDLDKEWVHLNINRIFPQRNEDHWQAAFSGYLLRGVREKFYTLLKAHGHYRKALDTRFADMEVLDGLVSHICTGWIEDSETLDDTGSLIYQLIHSGNPNFLASVVYFFSRRMDNLSEKVKVKVMPAWRTLFEVLSQHSNERAYQNVLVSLLGWLGLINKIDAEVLTWVKATIGDIGKTPGYGLTLSRLIKALRKHASKTPEMIGEIYLEIPQRIVRGLQSDADDIIETIRILYKKGYKDIADAICNRFGEAGVDFLKPVYAEHHR